MNVRRIILHAPSESFVYLQNSPLSARKSQMLLLRIYYIKSTRKINAKNLISTQFHSERTAFDKLLSLGAQGSPELGAWSLRRELPRHPEDRRSADPRSSHEGAQKVRPQGRPPRSAVQQALSLRPLCSTRSGGCCFLQAVCFSAGGRPLSRRAPLAAALLPRRPGRVIIGKTARYRHFTNPGEHGHV